MDLPRVWENKGNMGQLRVKNKRTRKNNIEKKEHKQFYRPGYKKNKNIMKNTMKNDRGRYFDYFYFLQ